MSQHISVEAPEGWSRSRGDRATWAKTGNEQAGQLEMTEVELAAGVEPMEAAVQLGRTAGWGTPLNLGEAECEHGSLAFVTFFDGPFSDARLWLVARPEATAVVFMWTGSVEAIGDEAEVIVLRTLGLIARPRSVFFGG